nr:hypothetical protein [Tanacetum cinerariifolium]
MSRVWEGVEMGSAAGTSSETLPDEHQLRFSKYKTARELWAAILKTFGGNEATKKRKKNLLKQQYGNFKAEGTETLEQTFNRLQVIVSQLQFMDVDIEKDDLNQKFLTSLAPEWLIHTIVWRNRNDLDSMSLDDLYNHLKVYEAEVQKKPNSNPQDMAFISSSKNSNNEDGNTVCVTTATTPFPTGSVNVATISQDTASAFIASQSNDKFWKKTGKKISIQGSDVAGFDKSKVECFNCHKMGHFARECRAPRNQERVRKESYRQGSKAEEKSSKALMAIDGDEKDLADGKLACLLKSSKDLEDIIESQRSEKVEEGVGYNVVPPPAADLYLSPKKDLSWTGLPEFVDDTDEKDLADGKLARLLKSSKDLEDIIESQRSEKVKEGVGYNAVPPPAADLYLSPKKDLSWTGLPEFVDDTVTDYSRPSPTVASTSAKDQNIDTSTSEEAASTNPSKPFIKFVKPKERHLRNHKSKILNKTDSQIGDLKEIKGTGII